MRSNRFVQPDGTETVHSSPRQEGTCLYVTGAGDNISTGEIGAGVSFVVQNLDGEDTASVRGQFTESVYLKDGYVMWQNAKIGDRLSLEVVLPAEVPLVSEESVGNAIEGEDGMEYVTESAVPDDTWVGTHLWFPVDVVINRFVNKVHMLGDNTVGLVINSSDAALVPKELVYVVKVYSPSKNADIVVSVILETYREMTV